MMRIHYLQHVPFESPARIADWATEHEHELTGTLLYEGVDVPLTSEFDMLVVLGGPMGIYDEEQYPWLAPEKVLIREAIAQRKLILGICLGAQLLAEALGGRVYQNPYKEIGWYPVSMKEESGDSVFFKKFPRELLPFHWHGDTFELPPTAATVASSIGCANQAFEYQGHVVGLQFHLECGDDSIDKLLEHCGDELEPGGPYVQSPDEMVKQPSLLAQSNALLIELLQAMEERHQGLSS
ncbi:type 1 glutamine amidotransferase [Paenibacillus senegalimassiliensis]|uniref:type 1 glutamine amidotransferase n=1 Tax=Paenibacillus senegalimassiliensis TaxID=1737426 RepID=UPI000AF0AF16|nr:type 1 glutamine amidotransferase [Paenibacillus senegalimassiliensis]